MKKIFLSITIVLLTLAIAGCADRKYSDDTINVVFFTNANQGGSVVLPYLEIEPGTLIEQPEDPTRPGFLFAGWYRNLERTIPWDFDNDVVGEISFLLYARWEAMISIINYDVNGGTMPNTNYPIEYQPGDRTVLPIPTRTGYTFIAWYLYDWDEENPNTRPGDPGFQTIPSNALGEITLYAHWRAIEVVVSFRTNFPVSGQGPANPANVFVKYGAEIEFPVFEDTAGYRFVGWNLRTDGEGVWFVNGESFTRTQRTTVNGIWEPIV